MRRDQSSTRIQLRSIEDEHIDEIHKHQNGDCREDVSGFLDFDPVWAPMSKAQVKEKLGELGKRDRTHLFGIWSNENEFLGLGFFSSGWDPWSPHFIVIIWPKHRRKGYGREAAEQLLDGAFNNYHAHLVSITLPDFSKEGLAFAKSLGFKEQGAKRRSGMYKGEFYNEIYLDILKREYLASHPQGGES